ncbi:MULTISPECIES: tyrosine-type recombinase/integrase [unclassified Streptomyces]|uniref:tyrosine-type recombinase/integrase n=1 Tax=unclassified Streptomyces TaxID=2593676 RepID=UPI002E12F909|nr:site-specific integrase [Streptomyces sp. NBC_01186]WSS44083.1 site-specific integrase [Streptomyces sp. NBC_01187]
MAGHIQDRWYKTITGPDGKTGKVKTDRHGTGKRYRARYVGPDGTEKSQSFPDGQKRRAEKWLSKTQADMDSGSYVDPAAGRITFERFAVDEWMPTQTTDPATRESVEMRLRLHAFPHIGSRAMDAFRSSHLKLWMRGLEQAGLSAAYRRGIFAHVSTVFSAAVEERVIRENPCSARSVKPPKRDPRRVRPWPTERVTAVRRALPGTCQAMVELAAGCGMRQGEIFGLGVEDIDALGGVVRVVRQVKLLRGGAVFAPPKGGKERDVPLPDTVSAALTGHMTGREPVAVTLPWGTLDGPPVTAALIFTSAERLPLNRNRFNDRVWRPALRAAGAPTGRENGMHALRHFYASVLLDAGESIKALSEYLGHHDPGFTLRTYTHLMPTSESRTRAAVDRALGPASGSDGPGTAHRPE